MTCTFEKLLTIRFCTLDRETRIEQFQLAAGLSENCQKILILTTENTCLRESR